MEEKICKSCGNNSFAKGIQDGYAHVRPEGKMFGGSPLELIICTKCGEVVSMKVKQPHKFKE